MPDKPNLYMKDYALYRGFYCGLCHEIGRCQGQCLRMGVNYDVTFLSILYHGLWEETPIPQKKACVLHPFRKKAVVLGEKQQTMAYLNTLLLDFKCQDDVLDGQTSRKAAQNLFARQIKKAKAKLPEVASVLQKTAIEQQKTEAQKPTSWRIAAEPFADCMQEILRLVCKEKYTPFVGNVGYHLGQYVYLMDALDDYEDDRKKGRYNPLALRYGEETKAAMVAAHKEELQEEIEDILNEIKENYRNVAVFATEGIVTNTLWMGLRYRAQQLLEENKKCLKMHTKF